MSTESQQSECVPCPICAEDIKPNAKKCKHCGEWLNGSSISHSPDAGATSSKEDSRHGEAEADDEGTDDKSQWRLKKEDKEFFFTDGLTGIVAWARKGLISPDAMVWDPRKQVWIAAKSIPEVNNVYQEKRRKNWIAVISLVGVVCILAVFLFSKYMSSRMDSDKEKENRLQKAASKHLQDYKKKLNASVAKPSEETHSNQSNDSIEPENDTTDYENKPK